MCGPVNPASARPPVGWQGWPNNKNFALVLTHDVDTQKGHDGSLLLMNLEKEAGVVSSFNFVPERYDISKSVFSALFDNGFEIGVHGLRHDGKLFTSKASFDKQAKSINRYIKEWGAVGFRAPSMIRNLEWIRELEIEYDASTFDTDPFEPQPEGAGSIFPFIIEPRLGKRGYVELPYTLCQDFSLLVLMKEPGIAVWKQKLDWIVKNGGMALINTHPDYMNFSNRPCGLEEYPAALYREFLEYVSTKYEGMYWPALARDMARFWEKRCCRTEVSNNANVFNKSAFSAG